jgi:hypothetical protein
MKLIVKEHNTSPIVIHGNGTGMYGDVYNGIQKLQFQKPYQFIKNKFTFISWKGGNIAGKSTILEESGKQYGFDVLNLEWKPTDGFWKGSQQKITETLNAINSGLINTEYVFWCDNTDVFFVESPDVFFEKYKKVYGEYDFVWNAEKNNYPRPTHRKWNGANVSNEVTDLMLNVIDTDETYSSSYRYMNSGAGFGKLSILKEMLEYANSLIQDSRLNDQGLMRIAQRKFQDKVVVDRNCELFLCCWEVEPSDVILEK